MAVRRLERLLLGGGALARLFVRGLLHRAPLRGERGAALLRFAPRFGLRDDALLGLAPLAGGLQRRGFRVRARLGAAGGVRGLRLALARRRCRRALRGDLLFGGEARLFLCFGARARQLSGVGVLALALLGGRRRERLGLGARRRLLGAGGLGQRALLGEARRLALGRGAGVGLALE